MDIVSENQFSDSDFITSGFLPQCADEKLYKKNTKFLLYLLKYDHAEMKTFIAPFLEALTYYQCLLI